MLARFAVVGAVALVPAVHHATPRHLPGCRARLIDTHGHRALCRRTGRAWAIRHRPTGEPVIASNYDDAEPTACPDGRGGTLHYDHGVANKTLPCGTRVRLCHGQSCEVATVQDRGPFIAGRTFDLNAGAKAAIGCDDLCSVRWAVVG